jgi:Domain of unknown function (DUF6285)
MLDLPDGPGLLALARDLLLGELLPRLPEEHRIDARLVANAMAIAERRAESGDAPERAVLADLDALYRDDPAPEQPPLRRFATDLRQGRFTADPARERAARALMWRLTSIRLREANPRFLAANGFS